MVKERKLYSLLSYVDISAILKIRRSQNFWLLFFSKKRKEGYVMAKIRSLDEYKETKFDFSPEDLNGFLRKNQILFRDRDLSSRSDILKGKKHLRRKIEKELAGLIIDSREVSQGAFMCGIYISETLVNFLSEKPESWIAFDYTELVSKSNQSQMAFFIKKGADVCFFLCSVFPDRGNWRLMNLEYYQKMGSSFYYQLYLKTGKEIGYHMSNHFNFMSRITNQCIKKI